MWWVANYKIELFIRGNAVEYIGLIDIDEMFNFIIAQELIYIMTPFYLNHYRVF